MQYFSVLTLTMQFSDLCMDIKLHTIGRFEKTVVTFMLLVSYCTANLWGDPWFLWWEFPTKTVSSLLQTMDHPARVSVLAFRIIFVILHPRMGQTIRPFQRANPGSEKKVISGKVTHSQPLPVGKHTTVHLCGNTEAYHPDVWLQLPEEFQYIIMPSTVLAGLLSVVFNRSGDHQQRMCG